MNARGLAGCALSVVVVGCFGGGGITPIRTAFNRGVYLYSVGAFDQAISEYRAALAENPDDSRARFNLGVTLEARAAERGAAGDPEAATEDRNAAEVEYRTVLARDPRALRAAINLAALEFERGEQEAAMQRLRGVIDANPGLTLPCTALAAHHLARGELTEAEALARQAVARDRGSAPAQFMLGEILRRAGRPDEARAAFERVLRSDADDLGALLALGELALEAGDDTAAASWLQRLLLIDPEHRVAHLQLATAMERLDDLEAATRHLWQARALGRSVADGAGFSGDVSARLLDLYARLAARERAR